MGAVPAAIAGLLAIEGLVGARVSVLPLTELKISIEQSRIEKQAANAHWSIQSAWSDYLRSSGNSVAILTELGEGKVGLKLERQRRQSRSHDMWNRKSQAMSASIGYWGDHEHFEMGVFADRQGWTADRSTVQLVQTMSRHGGGASGLRMSGERLGDSDKSSIWSLIVEARQLRVSNVNQTFRDGSARTGESRVTLKGALRF